MRLLLFIVAWSAVVVSWSDAYALDLSFSGDQSIPELFFQSLGLPSISEMLGGHFSVPATPFGAAEGVLLRAIMIITAAFATWSVWLWMVSAAHEGKTFGQKYSPWSVIKPCICSALLFPVTNGLNGACIGIFILAAAGSNLADKINAAYVDAVNVGDTNGNYTQLGLPLPMSGPAIAKAILVMETCRESYRAMAAAASGSGSSWSWLPGGAGDYVPPRPPAAGTTGAGGVQEWDYRQCGALSIAVADTNQAVRPPTASIFVPNDTQRDFMSTRIRILGELIQSIRSSAIAKQLADSQQAGTNATAPSAVIQPIKPAISAYEQSMLNASASFLTQYNHARSTIADAMKKSWTLIGLTYLTQSQMSAQAVAVASIAPVIVQPDLGDSIFNLDSTRQAAKTVELLRQIWDKEARKNEPMSGSKMSSLANDSSDFVTGTIQSYLNPLVESLISVSANASPNNAIQSMVDFGHRTVIVGWAMMGAGTAAAIAAGNTVSTSVGLNAGMEFAKSLIIFIICMILACGYSNAYVIPMLPFVTVLYAIGGWLKQICESLIAAQFTFLFGMRSDGPLVCEHTRGGLMQIFRMPFIPALIVISFILSNIPATIMLAFIQKMFPIAFVTSQQGHVSMLGAVVVSVSMYSIINYQILVRSFALTYQISQVLGVYIGGGGRDGHGESGHIEQTIGSVGGANTMQQAVQKAEGSFRSASKLGGGQGQGASKLPK